MCQANIGKVIAVEGNNAILFYKGNKIPVKTDLLKDVKVNERIMFSSGIAIEKVSEEDANYICGCNGSS